MECLGGAVLECHAEQGTGENGKSAEDDPFEECLRSKCAVDISDAKRGVIDIADAKWRDWNHTHRHDCLSLFHFTLRYNTTPQDNDTHDNDTQPKDTHDPATQPKSRYPIN